MRRANIVTSVLMFLFATYMFLSAIQMEYKTAEGVPGPGFIPLWTGVLIGLISLIMFYFNAVKKKPDTDKNPQFNQKFFFNSVKVIGASALSMWLVKYLGMLVSVGLLTGFLSWALGMKSWKTNILLAVITPLVFYFVFQQGLDLNFPKGLFGF